MLDEPGYLPLSHARVALVFHLISKPYGRTSIIITTKLSFLEWATSMQVITLKALPHSLHVSLSNYKNPAQSL
ncbi:MAG: ATP-binding protein [Methyloprofundus sp.]|nr:ATP-binding protein [Methyloprofundus sp.]